MSVSSLQIDTNTMVLDESPSITPSNSVDTFGRNLIINYLPPEALEDDLIVSFITSSNFA